MIGISRNDDTEKRGVEERAEAAGNGERGKSGLLYQDISKKAHLNIFVFKSSRLQYSNAKIPFARTHV